MSSVPRPKRDTDTTRPRPLRLADSDTTALVRLHSTDGIGAESNNSTDYDVTDVHAKRDPDDDSDDRDTNAGEATTLVRLRSTDGERRRDVASHEPTIAEVRLDDVKSGVEEELRAARNELKQLRSEVAELVEQLREVKQDPNLRDRQDPNTTVTIRPGRSAGSGPTAPISPSSLPAPAPRRPSPSPVPAQSRPQGPGQRPGPGSGSAPSPTARHAAPPAPVQRPPAPRSPGQPPAQRGPVQQPPAQRAPVQRPPAPRPPVQPPGQSPVQLPVQSPGQPPAQRGPVQQPPAQQRPPAPARRFPSPQPVPPPDLRRPGQTPRPTPAQQPATPRPTPRPAAAAAKGAPAAPAAPAKPASVPAGAPNDLEAGYSAVLAEVLGVAEVSPTGNFFDDLGADSLLMARFCARVRTRPELPNVGIKDIYRTPTIAELAAAGAKSAGNGAPVQGTTGVISRTAVMPRVYSQPFRPNAQPFRPRNPLPGPSVELEGADAQTVMLAVPTRDQLPAPVGTFKYVLVAVMQLLFLIGYPALIAFAFAIGGEWVFAAVTPLEIYVRSVEVAGAIFLGTSLLPILAKWVLIGRWKPTQFAVWSLRYYRFWLVKTLIRTSPLVRFVGSPLYVFYLRMLGAKIGKGVTILSPTVPVCTDLLTIGSGTIIRKSSSFACYRAHAGVIQAGPVTIGSNVLVGEATVLDIGSSLGDQSQLGHTSSLHAGQSVPAGERWHGSPAEPTTVNYRAVPTVAGGTLRKLFYSLNQLVILFGLGLPLGISGLVLLVREFPVVQVLVMDIETAASHVPFWIDVVILSSALFFGGLLLALIVMMTVPRVLRIMVRPGKTYRLYGSAYWALRAISRLTNSKFFTRVFGDSSYIVGFLRALGYRFIKVEQTGSNFGTAVAHDTPFLTEIGSGTVVADGLTIVNTDYSSTSFETQWVKIGARSFLGNGIMVPARSRVGDNCLLATKVMVPIEGEVRHNVGLLGSPSFEIPRSVDRDARLALGPEQRRRALKAKDRHNLSTIFLLLLSRWVHFTLVVALARYSFDLYMLLGPAGIAIFGAANFVLTYVYFISLDRTVRWLTALRPQGVSIYDKAFWRHERYWKVGADTYIQRLNGTPFKNSLWRALGVKVGRRVFDDGAAMTERVLVSIGDRCTLNERSTIQCHSQENDAFKSDRVVVGNGVTIGVGGFVHYGTRLGDGSVLEADSFLLKGEEISPDTRWGGNPAVELDSTFASTASNWRKS
ncbi:Pls/PosA family non-ribosomal peptide synthetase [Pseudonocardia sp. TRM90224]|uniref:Pls/PosA family non-ribosomal peptide synthetase n=1 Tax=Pseudonocardia sp. TRM90224 TaxID=2812678 RepID=UPI001E3E6D19|nr:Pls/PosA family non-ribosomal peptide synthetase [Pseudonocardia sp. TRM90224]